MIVQVLRESFNKHKYIWIFVAVLTVISVVELKINNIFERTIKPDLNITNHFLNDFSMIETNKEGHRGWELDGKRLEKYPQSKRSEVFSPSMRIFNQDLSFWTITAKHALDPDSMFESIYLTGDVIFLKIDSDDSNPNVY